MPELLTVSQALERLLATFRPVNSETVHLAQASGRVLAEDFYAPFDYPSFDNSSMDGFAVCSLDVAAASQTQPVTLAIVDDIPAGHVTTKILQPGDAARIMTGAVLPMGADAVVPVEDTDSKEYDLPITLGQVNIFRAVKPGDYVRSRGQDLHVGELLLSRGTRLRPQDVGLLAMLGIPRLEVYRLPRVAVLSSGDELIPVDEPLRPGMIHESNSTMLAALVSQTGDALYLGNAPDRPEAIQAVLDRAVAENVDLILTSAGVSVGVFDYVRSVVETNGRLDFWRVNMRPGKPLAFGSYRNVPFIGLPGNPVSAFVGFEVFVRPAIAKLAGHIGVLRPRLRVTLTEPVETDGRESYLRAVITWQGSCWAARLTGHQGSGNLYSLVQANALLIVPSEVKSPPTGTELDAWLLDPVF